MTSARATRAGDLPIPRAARGGPVEIALLALSVAALAGLTAEYLVSRSARLQLANLGWTSGALAALIGVAAARRRSAPRDRSGWSLLLVGCAAWLTGQFFWDAYSATSFPAAPNPADVCWLAFAVMSSAAVHRMGLGVWRSRGVWWLELVPLVVAVCSLMTALLWGDVQSSKLSEAGKLTSLAYPIFYVSAAVVMVQSALAGTIEVRRNPGMAAVLAGLVLEALAFILWSPLLLTQTYVAGTNAVDALWAVGMLLIGIGAWTAGPPVAIAAAEQVSRRRGGILPSLTFVTLACCQITFVATRAVTAAELALSIGVTVVGAALIARASILRRQQDALYSQLDDRGRELQDVNRRLSKESRLDALTGLGNRLRLHEDFVELSARAKRYGQGYALALCDLDRFKQYNDDHGHQAGDRALRQVAALLTGHAREGDRAYRYGGEELLLILPEQDVPTARAVAERHRANLEGVALPHLRNAPSCVVTFSAGVATARPGETPDTVLKRADDALYAAKTSGRNRTAVSHPQVTKRAAGAESSVPV